MKTFAAILMLLCCFGLTMVGCKPPADQGEVEVEETVVEETTAPDADAAKADEPPADPPKSE